MYLQMLEKLYATKQNVEKVVQQAAEPGEVSCPRRPSTPLSAACHSFLVHAKLDYNLTIKNLM